MFSSGSTLPRELAVFFLEFYHFCRHLFSLRVEVFKLTAHTKILEVKFPRELGARGGMFTVAACGEAVG